LRDSLRDDCGLALGRFADWLWADLPTDLRAESHAENSSIARKVIDVLSSMVVAAER
jgi:hypothetical protein